MSEYPMQFPPVTKECSGADVNQQQPPPYEVTTRNDIGLKPTQYEPQRVVQPGNMMASPGVNYNLNNIEEYYCWSILNILCCFWILGAVACGFSCITQSSKQRGDLQGALNASRTARTLNIIATIIGVIVYIIYIIYYTTSRPYSY
jgi:hypothetical protein